MHAFAVAHNFLREFEADVIQARLGKFRILNSRIPNFLFPASPFARTKTVSFVLMSPSTVMRLKLCATASFNAACKTFASIAASVVMKHSIVACSPPCGNAAGRAPVGAHAGLDHARAFADAADAHRLAAELEFHRDLFRLACRSS